MQDKRYQIRAKVWLYPGKAGWYFVTLPETTSDEINIKFEDKKRGWGSLPVSVTVGSTSWKTSIFPDKKAGAYLLPIKAEVRKREGIAADSQVSLLIEILV
jgi:hypothetical protein